ncbi:MAG TPA: carboxypeptidase regulatory-like domain-containing protein [Candidatus Acidoferrales bacterium]|nr:carboxypeptidase regulatory-like domain-containing protein [Candidatus Acidoferrales bacterium]
MRLRFDKYFRAAVSFIALLLLLPTLLSAQSVITGGLTGIVTDPSGSVIAGAGVNLKNQSTSEIQSATTGSNGAYQFTLLKPGIYVVSVSQTGFKQVTETVEVLLGQTALANVKLEVGAISETVTVTEQGALLQTEDANISSNFDTNQIQNIPNPGGDITYVAQTAPGITMNNSTGGGYGNFSAFGLPGTSNLFTVNGNDYNDAFLNLNNSGSSNLLLGGNELQEVAVVSNGYTGQYGRQAGAQIDYSTKSGSNAFHGDAVYNWTGRALTANDPINKATELSEGLPNSRPFENNNQWAAALGGPIKKDKAYFFVNTEGIRYIFGSIQNVSVPTPAFENFVQGNVPGDPATQAFYANVFKLYNGAPGIGNAKPNANSCPGFVTAPGATGGACTESFTESVSSGNKEWLLSGRVDYNLGENDKIFGRVRFDRGVQPTYTDPINPVFNNSSTQPQNEGQLNYTHIFSPTVVNNFIFSDLYYAAVFGNLNPSSALGLFPGNLEFLVDGALTPLGTGSGNPNGFAAGFQFPEGRHVEQWQLVDDLSVTRGNHNFKMGVNFRRDDVSDYTAAENTLYPEVDVTLFGFANNQVAPAGCSANPPTNNQAGCGSVLYNFASQIKQPVAYYSVGFYFQDEYRVNSRLKLTMTLRADRNSGGVCQSSCASLPVTPFNDLPHGATIPYDESFTTGNKTVIPGIEKVVFEPRFGLAWSPIGQNTVIRAGVGLFTDLYPGGLLSLFDTNFPQVNLFNVPTGSVAFDLASPGSTAFPGSGVNLVTQCNGAFLSNYNSGGSLTTGGSSGGGYAGAAQPFGGCLNAQGALSVPNLNDVSRNLQNPKYVEWNLELQHTFGARTVVSANYVGNHGYDGLVLNPTLNGFGFGSLPASAPDPRVGRVDYLYSGAVSNYDGVTFSIQENEWHGLTGRLNYTYSHALDELSNVPEEPFSLITSILTQVNPFNLHSQYASGDNDARHQISGSYVYQLPFKSEKRLVNAAIGGWVISGTMFYRSGFPFSIIDGGATAGLVGNNLGGTSSFGATILAQPLPTFTQRNFTNGRACVLVGCFSPADFATSTDFMGDVGRNAFRGPGFLGGDLSVKKNIAITERMTFQIGFNAYNWFNHANYGAPYPNTNAPFFGQVAFTQTAPTSPYGAFAAAATDQRIAQITGKFIF